MLQKYQCTRKCTNLSANYAKNGQITTSVLYNIQTLQDIGMKLTVVLETRRIKSNGKFPVRIRFNFKGQAYYVSTGLDVNKENFMLGKIVGIHKASMYNVIIAQKLEYTQSVLEDLQFRGLIKTKFKTGTEIKRFIESGDEGYEVLDRDERMKIHFKTYVENHKAKYKSKSSESQYDCMLSKVADFCEMDSLFITDITVAWLKDFNTFCEKSGMSTNGIGNYMRSIRTVWNDAIDRELIGIDKYPFRRFKIKRAKTKHRNVTVDDLRYMLNFDYVAYYKELKAKSKKHTAVYPEIEKYVDLFFLSFYLCGLNLKDLLFLRKNDIRNGQLSIMRDKTNEPIVIRIEPEAKYIIDKYAGNKYLLNFMDGYSTDDFKNLEHRMNRNLKHVLPFVSGYWARHSWATLAGELDVADPIIDVAQGRVAPGMSAVYINRNISKVSDANRKVIDYVLNFDKDKINML